MNAKKQNSQDEKERDKNDFYQKMMVLSLNPTDSAYPDFLLVQTEEFVKKCHD